MGRAAHQSQAVDFENQRNRSNGIAGGASAARHLANATREIEIARVGRSGYLPALHGLKVRCSAIELGGQASTSLRDAGGVPQQSDSMGAAANPLVQIPCFKKAPALATLLAVVMHLVQGMIVPVRSTALAHKATCHGGELHNVAMMQR